MHDVKSSILCSIDILFTFINNELYRMILDIQTFVCDTIKGKKKTKKEKYISRRIYIDVWFSTQSIIGSLLMKGKEKPYLLKSMLFQMWNFVSDARIYLMTTNDINNTRYCGTLIVVGRRAHACRSPGLITAARSCSNLVTSLPISRVHRAEWKFISFVSLYDRSVGSYWNFEEISRLSRSILNDLYREQNFHFD